jgi:hypothetical protein
MTDKLWFRKSDGALVRPTMREPSTLENEDDWNIWSWNIWRKHLSSLPALTNIVIDPEYAKTLKDGWVKVERVRYQTGEHSTWYNCHKAVYYNTYPKSRRRLVILAPVEKVEDDFFKSIPQRQQPINLFDMSKTKEEILNAAYEPRMHWEKVNKIKVLTAMSEYASECTAPLEARIRELEEGLRNVEIALPQKESYLDDNDTRNFYWRVIVECREHINNLLSSAYDGCWRPLPQPPKQ